MRRNARAVLVAVLKILCEPAAPSEPRESPFHHPSSGDDLEARRRIGSFDDFRFQAGQEFPLCLPENRPLVSTVGKQFLQKRKLAEQGSQHQNTAIPVLDTGRMDHGVKQQPYGVDKDVALLSLDFLARVIARRIDAGPPFSAPFTL